METCVKISDTKLRCNGQVIMTWDGVINNNGTITIAWDAENCLKCFKGNYDGNEITWTDGDKWIKLGKYNNIFHT